MMEEPPRSQICDQSRIKGDLVPLSFLFSADDNSDCSFHLSSSADEPGSSRLLPTRGSTLTQIQLITINNIASRMVDYDPMIITIIVSDNEYPPHQRFKICIVFETFLDMQHCLKVRILSNCNGEV